MALLVFGGGAVTVIKKGFLPLTIGRHVYQFKVNRNTITIWNPLGQKDMPRKTELMGLAEWPAEDPPQITSQNVEDYIRRTKFVTAQPA